MENLNNEIKGKLVTPIGDFNCQSFPIIEDKKYFITDEELEKLGKHELKWHYEEETIQVEVDDLEKPLENEQGYEKKLVDKVITIVTLVENDNTRELQVASALKEQAEIHKWLEDNDWKVNKITLGEWLEDDPRVIEYKRERLIKRNRLDELEEILQDNNEGSN